MYFQDVELAYPVMSLMHAWGDVHLLMCQYTQDTHMQVKDPVEHPYWISAVYYFLSPSMSEKLYTICCKKKQLQYLWVCTLRFIINK